MANTCINQAVLPKTLNTPPLCSSQRGLRYTDMHTNYNGPFINRSYSFIKSSEVKTTPKYALKALSDQTQLPKNWSWRNQGGNKIEDGRRNQGRCGSCWAFSLVSALGDRYAIKYQIAAPYPSAMLMISCGGPDIYVDANQQCLCGGSPSEASKWLEKVGNSIGLESCWPYSTVSDKPYFPADVEEITDTDTTTMFVAPKCPKKDFDSNCCADCCYDKDADTTGVSNVKFNVKEGSTNSPLLVTKDNDQTRADIEATIDLIKHDIFNNGPISTTFFVPGDFQTWWFTHTDTDIYTPTSDSPPIIGTDGHGVVLTGWGQDEKGCTKPCGCHCVSCWL